MEEEFIRAFEDLKDNKDPGVYNIPPGLLKKSMDSMKSVLNILECKIYDTGIFFHKILPSVGLLQCPSQRKKAQSCEKL